MKFKHLPAPKSPKSSAWGYLLGLLGLLGAGVPVILFAKRLLTDCRSRGLNRGVNLRWKDRDLTVTDLQARASPAPLHQTPVNSKRRTSEGSRFTVQKRRKMNSLSGIFSAIGFECLQRNPRLFLRPGISM